jgi:predicted PurR-regulated permease PerM
MAAPGPTIQIPRWIQLVGLPVALVLAYLLASTLGHAIFLFLAGAVIGFLLNPLVRGLERLRIRRGLAVAIVFVGFAAVVILSLVVITTVVVDQTGRAADRIDAYVTEEDGQTGLTGAEEDVDRFQGWLDRRGIHVEIRERANDWIDSLGAGEISNYSQDVFTFARGAAVSIVVLLFSIVLIVVIAIYMLLDMPRLEAVIDRRFPPAGGPPLTLRIERALAGYVRGQVLLSTIIGTSAGVGMWILGVTGLVPGAERYALLFGVWTAIVEVIPYIGPWLSAVPPMIYALVVDPIWGALWVAGLFVFIYQIEGHIVVPNVMANALRLHPLLVIFGLLAGGELYGLPGVLLALPTMAAGRAIWDFFRERVELEQWREGEQLPLPLDVESEQRPPPPRVVRGG